MPSIDDDGDEDEEDEADEEEEEEDKYLRRLGKGLLGLQLVDYVLAWICMEDDGVRWLPLTLPVDFLLSLETLMS